jgi:hypothetical protein
MFRVAQVAALAAGIIVDAGNLVFRSRVARDREPTHSSGSWRGS